MSTHTLKEWVAATRYWSFSVSAFPVIATTALLASIYGVGAINWGGMLLTVLGVVLFQAAGNMLSDVGDFRSGADCEEAFAVPNLVKHIFEPKEYLRLSAVFFALGSAIGLYLAWTCGWPVLAIGVVGFIMTLCYTKSKLICMSDLTIFIIFGILIIAGTAFVVLPAGATRTIADTSVIATKALLVSVPIGLITLSVLHANNAVDIKTDKAAGLHTVAMAMGLERAAKVYVAYQLIPFLYILVTVALGVLPWTSLLCLVAFVPALGNIKKALQYKEQGREALIGLDLMSAKLQLIFCLLLSAGLFAAVLL